MRGRASWQIHAAQMLFMAIFTSSWCGWRTTGRCGRTSNGENGLGSSCNAKTRVRQRWAPPAWAGWVATTSSRRRQRLVTRAPIRGLGCADSWVRCGTTQINVKVAQGHGSISVHDGVRGRQRWGLGCRQGRRCLRACRGWGTA